MLNRRTLLQQAASWLPSLLLPRGYSLAQTSTRPKVLASDEMTRNTAQQQAHYPPLDFGPLPAQLPPETLALSGPHSLRAHAKQHNLLAGAALVQSALATDPALQQLVAEQFGLLVPETELKWVALRPSEDRYHFAPADAMLRFAREHGMAMRGHTLVWHNSVPDWLRSAPRSTDVRALLLAHIQTVVGHFRGQLQSWDVVNEAILPADQQPDGLRKSFWYDRVGSDYIEVAFRAAHEADPVTPLVYNDYGVEYDNAEDAQRRRLLLGLLRSLRAKKVPIHAVGIQGHIKAAATSPIGSGLRDYIEAIRQLGLAVYITELDVNEDDVLANDVATRDAAVAATYRQFLGVALANPAVQLVLTWGVSDRRTWLNGGPTHHRKQPDRPQRSLPFDPEYRPTRAFFAMRDSFDARGSSRG